MNRQLLALIRATLNSTFGISAMRWRYFRRRERVWELLLSLFGIGTLAVMMGAAAYQIAAAACASGAALGQPELGLGLAVIAGQSLVLFTGFFMVVSAFYFARDLATLVPLPLSPGMIVTAKFVAVLVGEYITLSILYWPAVAAYARYAPFGLLKAIIAVVVFLALPVIPLAIGGAAALLLMRGISRRQRDIMFYVGSLAFLALMFAWQMSMNQMVETSDLQQYLIELINTRLGLVRALAGRFPPAVWATGAVHAAGSLAGLTYLGLTAGSAAAALVALSWIGGRLFMRGLLGGMEEGGGRSKAAARRKMAQAAGGSLLASPAAPIRALARREWLLLSRTPIWIFNNVLPGVIMPVFMFLPLMAQQSLQDLLAQVSMTPNGRIIAGAALAAFLTFVGAVSGVAVTSVSREGERIWISRVLPQTAAVQLQAKLLVSIVIAALSTLPTLVGYALVFRPAPAYLALPALVGIAGSFAVMTFGLLLDSMRPMLHWTDPQEPVKRNLNALIPLGFAFVLIAAGAAVMNLALRAGIVGTAIYLLLLLIAAVADALCYRLLLRDAEGRFARLEL